MSKPKTDIAEPIKAASIFSDILNFAEGLTFYLSYLWRF
jgi:hypothetical protein